MNNGCGGIRFHSITTATPEEGVIGQVSAEGGKYGTQQFAGSVGARGDWGDVHLSASDFSTDGFNARTTDTSLGDDDGYDTVNRKTSST